MKKTLLLILLLLLIFAVGWVFDRRIRADAETRASSFIATHFLAMETLSDSLAESPQDISELSERFGGSMNSVILATFPGGLDFHTHPRGFDLAEPKPRRISLFRSDRLVASDTEWPHWEKSGTKAWKYEGQEIPPGYLNEKP